MHVINCVQLIKDLAIRYKCMLNLMYVNYVRWLFDINYYKCLFLEEKKLYVLCDSHICVDTCFWPEKKSFSWIILTQNLYHIFLERIRKKCLNLYLNLLVFSMFYFWKFLWLIDRFILVSIVLGVLIT